MTDDHITAICAEYGIRIVPVGQRLGVKETNSISTLRRIFDLRGEDHLRLVLVTVAETENNSGRLWGSLFWAVSDLVTVNRDLIEEDASRWLALFDRCPVGLIQWEATGPRGVIPPRSYIAAGIYRYVVKEYGDRAIEPDLFDDDQVDCSERT